MLPSLFSELEGPVSGIVEELSKVPYLSEIVIGQTEPAKISIASRSITSPDFLNITIFCGMMARDCGQSTLNLKD